MFIIGEKILVSGLGEGKIINICLSFSQPYLIEFFNKIIDGHDGNGCGAIKGKVGYCWWCHEYELKQLNSYKTKKLYGIAEFCKKYYK